ncbi:MAG: alpha/beta hydrolase [Gammaproteobacteria bacterium]|nr:alpha/beta hydrolase [Gammaproteobacteria bacterium]
MRHAIKSKALGGLRHIRVHLPEGHSMDGGKTWPVLYLLDGQRYFAHGIALDRSLKDFDKVPSLIVVGIESPANIQDRAADFTENAAAYQAFLRDELLPFMADHYGAGKIRVLFGWQYAGRMVLDSFIETPGLFDTYAIASPWPNNREFVARFASVLNSNPDARAKLVLASADNEGIVTQGAVHLKSALEADAGEKIAWTYKEYNDEEHTSTAYRTIALGLNTAFADYRWLHFEDVATYKAFGGVNALRAHYRARAKKYGVSSDVADETIHHIAMIAERADDVNTMEEVLTAFPGYTGRANAYWLMTFGKLYLKHGRAKEAHALFSVAAGRFPDDGDIRDGLLAAEKALKKG